MLFFASMLTYDSAGWKEGKKRRKEGGKWAVNTEIEVYGAWQTGTDFGVKWR